MKALKYTDAQKAFVITQGEEQRLWHPAAQARVATSDQADTATLLPKFTKLPQVRADPNSGRCCYRPVPLERSCGVPSKLSNGCLLSVLRVSFGLRHLETFQGAEYLHGAFSCGSSASIRAHGSTVLPPRRAAKRPVLTERTKGFLPARRRLATKAGRSLAPC